MTRVKCSKCEFVNVEPRGTCARCGAPLPRVRISGGSSNPQPGMPAEGAVLRPGQVVAGRYAVIDIIGRGGMGCIYRVRDNTLGEEVALKTLLPQFVQNKLVVERFFNEARIARHLSHPNIIRMHDIGQSGNLVYISMELLKGRSLRTLIDEQPKGTLVPVDTALHVFDQLCAGLEYAHQYTVHRDIKPENIMILADGTVKLMDFGISKLMADQRLTAAAVVMGTPMYMSPEQIKDSRDVDARADVFSVGVVMYETLTGNLPTGVPKPVSQLRRDVWPQLDAVITKCVEPDREKRYRTIGDLRNEIRQLSSGPGLSSLKRTSAAARASTARPTQRNTQRWIGLMLAVLIIAGAALGLWQTSKARNHGQGGRSPASATAHAGSAGFQRISAVIDRVSKQASDLLLATMAGGGDASTDQLARGFETPPQTRERKERILRQGNDAWESAKNLIASDEAQAMAKAREALICFAGIMLCPDGMVFIPPGTITISAVSGTGAVQVDGFFIDQTEVTVRDYTGFCQAARWREPSSLAGRSPSQPVTSVTFYDAQAFAAQAGKRLPTEAQWARAAYGAPGAAETYPAGASGRYNTKGNGGAGQLSDVAQFKDDYTLFGCFDMAGNVSEWTRTKDVPLPYNPDDGRDNEGDITFDVKLIVRGEHYLANDAKLSTRQTVLYEDASDTMGFRCVKSLPSVDELLATL